MTRAMDEVMRTVSPASKDASYTLGATTLETSSKVVVRQVLSESSENAPQLAAGMNRRVGWQAASLGAAKQIQVANVTKICVIDAPRLAGGYSLLPNVQRFQWFSSLIPAPKPIVFLQHVGELFFNDFFPVN